MCMIQQPKMQQPVLPPEPAQMKQPDSGAIRSSWSRRLMDQMRSASGTVLTSGSGVSDLADTGKKTLLGQ